MLKHSMGKFDALATHAYPPENKRFDLKTGKLFDVQQTLTEWARQPAQLIATMADAWEEYKALPGAETGKIKVFFDRWAFSFRDSYKGHAGGGAGLPRVLQAHRLHRMAGYTMATAWMNVNPTTSSISAKGPRLPALQQALRQHPGRHRQLAPAAPQYPAGGDQPKVNTGSATYPLDVMAALTADGRALTVAVVSRRNQPRAWS